MSGVLNQNICLRLNSSWCVIGYCSIEQAIVALNGKPGGTPPAVALDIEMDADGKVIRSIPTKWEDWIKLPVKEGDPSVMGVRGPIRAPLIIIDANYSELPMKTPKLSNETILERDGWKCMYSGEKLTRETASVDHVIPKDVWKKRGLKGSPNRWDNLVAAKKELNFRKGNKTNRQAALSLLKKPVAPKPVPAVVFHKPKLDVHAPFFPNRDQERNP